jgi:hypothetical protein
LVDIRVSVSVLAVISCEITIAFTSALLQNDPTKAELGWDDIIDHFERVIGLATYMLPNDEHASRLYSRPPVNTSGKGILAVKISRNSTHAQISDSNTRSMGYLLLRGLALS